MITFCILAPEGVWHFPKRRFCFFLLLLLSLVLVVCNCGHVRREQRRRAKLGRRKVGEKSNRNHGIQCYHYVLLRATSLKSPLFCDLLSFPISLLATWSLVRAPRCCLWWRSSPVHISTNISTIVMLELVPDGDVYLSSSIPRETFSYSFTK